MIGRLKVTSSKTPSEILYLREELKPESHGPTTASYLLTLHGPYIMNPGFHDTIPPIKSGQFHLGY